MARQLHQHGRSMIAIPFGDRFAYDAADSEDVRSEKASIFLVSTSCCAAGIIWSAMYVLAFGFGLTAGLPLMFVAVVGSALVYSHIKRQHRPLIYAQIASIIYIPAFLQWNIGGVSDAGFVMAWSFLGPLIALMFFSVWQAVFWQGMFLLNVIVTVAFDDFFAAYGETASTAWQHFFFAMNLSLASTVVFVFAAYFVRSALNEKQKADGLLLNILPERIARTLKSRRDVIADEYDGVSVLFADIVNYTAYSSTKKPAEVVSKLNDVFHRFDELAERHGLEKIKTIGDAYMVVGGLPEPYPRHHQAIAAMALDMMEAVGKVEADEGKPFSLRIGIHTGPVVAGVIGQRKFAYDLWGDTVNVASRLETSAEPGMIQVSDALYQSLKDEYVFERQGMVELKGKGEVKTCYLVNRQAS